jgi:hypothetical protein
MSDSRDKPKIASPADNADNVKATAATRRPPTRSVTTPHDLAPPLKSSFRLRPPHKRARKEHDVEDEAKIQPRERSYLSEVPLDIVFEVWDPDCPFLYLDIRQLTDLERMPSARLAEFVPSVQKSPRYHYV